MRIVNSRFTGIYLRDISLAFLLGIIMYKSALAHFPHGQSATFHCHPRRDYEDCKQFLKLSLNLTHTLERPERQWPLPLARQSPQTFPMGRAESEDAAYGADILRKLRMTSPTASSSDKIKNGSTASEKAESISRLHLPLSAHLKK